MGAYFLPRVYESKEERGKICTVSLNSQAQFIFSTESVDTTTIAAVGTKAGIS